MGCPKQAHDVCFVLPNGYRGPFVIQTRSNKGVEIEKTDGVFFVLIPESGVLYVKERGPFYDWMKVSAKYENNVQIPVDDDIAADVVAMAFLSSGGDQTIWYYVGTRASREKALSAPEMMKVGPYVYERPP